MADLKISELTPASVVAGSDILPIVASGENFSATISQIASAVTVPPATTSSAGTMSADDKTKLDGIATGATANSSDATLLNRANHTGTQLASTISNFSEATDDRVAALLVAGTNITLTYNDGANTLTIDSAGGGGGGGSGTVTSVSGTGTVSGLTLTGTVTTSGSLTLGGTLSATASNISDFSEAVDDRVSSLLVAGTDVTLSYNDGANTLTVNSTPYTAGQGISVTSNTIALLRMITVSTTAPSSPATNDLWVDIN